MRHRIGPLAVQVLVLAALVAGTAGFAAMGKVIRLDIDGDATQIRTFATTAGDVLAAHEVELDAADKISIRPEESISDGDSITVRYAKPVTLTIDGERTEEVVHDVTVGSLLERMAVDVDAGAYLSHGPEDVIGRDGAHIVVSNPKDIVVVADGEKRTVRTEAPTTQHLMTELGLRLGADDEIEPAVDAPLASDAVVRIVRIEKVTKTEVVEVDYETTVEEDDTAFKGEVEVVREGKQGKARERVVIVKADGKVRDREVISRTVLTKPRKQIEKRGTKELPGVWDRLAQCESGGNWSINTGNGYYGGLQFSAATWRSVGGTGLPHQHSREEQIKRGMILQERSGWGQWPSCSRKLGLR